MIYIDNYQDPQTTLLSFAERDAQELASVLEDWVLVHNTVVFGPEATRSRIMDLLSVGWR